MRRLFSLSTKSRVPFLNKFFRKSTGSNPGKVIKIPTLPLLLFFVLTTPALSAQNTKAGNWCADVKNLQLFGEKDAEKVTGAKLESDADVTTFLCPLKPAGADSAVTSYFTEGRLFSIVAYYGTGSSRAEGEKLFLKVLSQFRECYPSASKLQYPHEEGFNGEAWSTLNEEETCKIFVGKTFGILPPSEDPTYRLLVVIQFL